MWQKDNLFIMSGWSFGHNLFLSRLLQRRQKPSLLGKELSRHVTHYILCSSHIDLLKKVVTRWHKKRAEINTFRRILLVIHLRLYHNAGDRLRTILKIKNVFLEFLKVFTLIFSVCNNRRQQNEFRTFCDHAKNMTLTVSSSS